NLDLAQDIYNKVELKYKNGLASSLELTTSQTDLETARANYLTTVYDFFIAELELQQSLGNIN
ncbi:MAG: TolC family protein, partial [Bacteroidota bacterium]